MGTTTFKVMMALIASIALVSLPGCSKKSVQSGGDTRSSQQRVAKSGGLHDGTHLLQVVDVECGDAISVLGGVVQHLTH